MKLPDRTIAIAVGAFWLAASAGPVAADVHERDILLSGTGAVCTHSMETRKVKLHTNPQKKKKEKKDVVVWQVINDCEKPQMVYLCIEPDLLDKCASLPPALGADVNKAFRVDAGERVSLVCRGANLGGSSVVLDSGDTAECLLVPKYHKIDIEIVP
jgi:hypothetical protein